MDRTSATICPLGKQPFACPDGWRTGSSFALARLWDPASPGRAAKPAWICSMRQVLTACQRRTFDRVMRGNAVSIDLHGFKTLARLSVAALCASLFLVGCSGGGSTDAPASSPAPVAPAPAPTPPTPPSVALTVAPDTVQQTAAANLHWTSSNASACDASGGWSGPKNLTGAESTGALAATTSYTLTCMGSGGTAGQTVTANVTAPPSAPQGPSVSLAAVPSTVESGGASTLTWSSANATACSASGNWSGSKATSGSASTGPLTANSSFALTCTGAGGTATQSVNVTVVPPVAPPLPSVMVSATPSTVASGGGTTLNWTVTNAASCTASGGWTGSKALSGSEARSGLTSTTTYTLSCTGAGGTASQSVTVTVTPPSAPPSPTISLTASPTAVANGGTSTLNWSTANASSCTAAGGWAGTKALSGSEARTGLTTTTTFTLTCNGSGGATASQSVTVSVSPPVSPPPPSVSLTAAPSSVANGGSTTLAWSASNATACTASGGWSGTKALSGSEARSGLTSTTTFVLTCTGAGGSGSQSVTVNVAPPNPPPTLALSATPNALVQGNASTLSWSTTNATSCAAAGDWTGTKATSGTQSTGALSTIKTYTYTLACTGPGGSTTQSATVAVSAAPPVPTVTLSANPAQVAQGGTSTLTWSSSNATNCLASGGWSGTKATSGTQVTSALAQTTTFTLTCTGAGGSASKDATVSVTPPTPAPTLALTASPSAIVQGGSSTLNWTSTNATSCVASGDWSGTKATSGSEATGALSNVRTYSYTLTCTGAGGTASQTAMVVVSATPPVPTVTISATPSQVAQGGNATLNWSSTNATSCTASGGWSGTKATSGTQATAALTQTTSFVLTCSGAGGSASNTATVSVTAPPTTAAFPLRVAADQRHLIDQNGKPFLVVGDTPWSIFTAITKADAEAYLEDRRQRGFNAIIVNIIEHFFNGPVNRDLQAPFAKTGSVYDFSKPNDAYFAHVDYVLGLARDKGFLVLMTPAYLGYGGGSEGWWPEINTSVNTEAVMENYGRYLGSRYRTFNNILWVMGGDYYAAATLAKTRAIVRGIQATDQTRLFTAHNARQESGLLYYTNESWFTVNTTYSNCDFTAQRSIEDYQRSRVMPFVYFEGNYENDTPLARCLRGQAYWPVLSGAIGSFFGNTPLWRFDSGWQAHLNTTGAQSMTYFGKLFASRAWEKLVPDTSATVLTGGRGALGADYAAAALTSDRATLIVFTPTQRDLTVDLTRLSGSTARAWWFNPANGTSSLIGDFPLGSRTFRPPSAQDWVLVVDDASLNLAAPGQ